MKEKLLAQTPAVNFPDIIKKVFPPESLPAKANLTLGDIVSRILLYIFVLAGLILFGFLIFGGFELLTSAGNPDKVKAAQGKITNAIVGFIIIFLSYWIVQILEIIFGISILG